MPALAIRAYTATTALGRGRDAQADALNDRRSGLRRNDFGGDERLDCWIGRVDGLEQSPLPSALAAWECRNNRLAWLALQQDELPVAIAEVVAAQAAASVVQCFGLGIAAAAQRGGGGIGAQRQCGHG